MTETIRPGIVTFPQGHGHWATGASILAPFSKGGATPGNLGMTEILLIGLALLLYFGPSKLPELGKSLGKGIGEFKKASKAITDELP